MGGVTLAVFGAAACFTVNAISFLALVVALMALPGRTRHLPPRHRRGVRPALAFAIRDPASRRLLVGMAIFCALAAPFQELAPVVAKRLGEGPGALGALLGAMGGGALLGVWALERLTGSGYPRHLALPIATLGFAAGGIVVALSPWLPLTVLAMACSGFFWIWMFAGTNTAIQLGSPRDCSGGCWASTSSR